MADRTSETGTIDRTELAAYLQTLAEEFDGESETISVRVGNKSVTLQPPTELEYEISVIERSSVLRGNRETVCLEIDWKP